jgi:hypothetical protein
MKIQIQITEKELRALVCEMLSRELSTPLQDGDIKIEVKSKQNYKSEWESASFRARVDVDR